MNTTVPQTDYESFDPAAYLQEYYLEVGPENKFLVETAARAYKDFPNDSLDILEVGGGPTVYQIISSARAAKTIHFSDYSQNNLDEVQDWLNGDGFNWEAYIKVGLKAEGVASDHDAVMQRKAEMQHKVTKLSRYDIISDTMLATGQDTYDLVSCVFASDAITHSVEGWKNVLLNLAKRIKSGGQLVLVGVTGSNAWVMGGKSFKATNLSEEVIRKTLSEVGFTIELYESTPAEDGQEHGYDGVFYLRARKQN
ncbi:MAG: nicotinamide N-methyltransferase-like [Candidatus Saccharibacteria bacterium]|nr:nicotinamide N-methyltransferase-like [Candidatus Saccharibacteria bacterium]